MEQRINLKLLYKMGKLASESQAILQQVYGEEIVTLKSLQMGVKASKTSRRQ